MWYSIWMSCLYDSDSKLMSPYTHHTMGSKEFVVKVNALHCLHLCLWPTIILSYQDSSHSCNVSWSTPMLKQNIKCLGLGLSNQWFLHKLHVGEYNVNIISLMYQNINVFLKLQYIQKFIYYVKW